jgi:hypothetical protein
VERQLEFDLVVLPKANPASIRFAVSGVTKMATDNAGNLVLSSTAGDLLLHKPFAYQKKNGAGEPVNARFLLL